jgi:hypothetical protein
VHSYTQCNVSIHSIARASEFTFSTNTNRKVPRYVLSEMQKDLSNLNLSFRPKRFIRNVTLKMQQIFQKKSKTSKTPYFLAKFSDNKSGYLLTTLHEYL